MRKFFVVMASAIAIFAGLLVTTPAQAQGPIPIPTATLTSVKFYPVATNVDLCVAVGDNTIPIGAMAQAWNNAAGSLKLNAAGNCLTERQINGTIGYPPSRRMTIDTYSAADGNCVKFTNVSPYPTYFTYADSFTWWTNNPVGYVNTFYATCYGTALLRQKFTAIAEGFLLGARILSGPSWNGRGMSTTSQLYGPSASTDGVDVGNLYNDFYHGIH